jgi:hypothetical protein
MLFQAAGDRLVSRALSSSAKSAVMAGVLVALAAAAAPEAQAQARSVLSPSVCAAVGGTIGGVAGAVGSRGSGSGHSSGVMLRQMAVGGLGALAGAAIGATLCDDTPSAKPGQPGQGGQLQGRGYDGVPLSFDERSRMDILLRNTVVAKDRWISSLRDNNPANFRPGSPARAEFMAREEAARGEFELLRQQLYVATRMMANANVSQRDIVRYTGAVSAFLELPVQAGVDYQMVSMQEQMLQRYNPAYQNSLAAAGSVPWGPFSALPGQAPRFAPAPPPVEDVKVEETKEAERARNSTTPGA